MLKVLENRTVTHQAVTLTKLFHGCERATDCAKIEDLRFDLLQLCIDAVDNIGAVLVFVSLQLQKLFDLRKSEAEGLRTSDEDEAIRRLFRILTMTAL